MEEEDLPDGKKSIHVNACFAIPVRRRDDAARRGDALLRGCVLHPGGVLAGQHIVVIRPMVLLGPVQGPRVPAIAARAGGNVRSKDPKIRRSGKDC